jgi:hypothetical protein
MSAIGADLGVRKSPCNGVYQLVAEPIAGTMQIAAGLTFASR